MISTEARGAWKELERHLRPYLARRVASAADIDDLLQDIFLRMHQSAAALRDDERFGGWVYRIASSAVIDKARKRARAPRLTDEPEAEPALDTGTADVSDEQLQSELSACVAIFVSQLPSPYREAITLTELEGLTQKAAAEMLGISLPGLKSRVQRGRDKLRDMFEDCCQMSIDRRGHVTECEPRGPSGADSCSSYASPRPKCH